MPVAPPAPPQAAPQPQYQPNSNAPAYRDQYDTSDQFDDGSYDERWNNPGYRGDGRQQAPAPVHRPAPAPQQSYNYQNQQPQYQSQPQYNPQPAPAQRQQNYNVPAQNYNNPASNYVDTTPSPNRFFPPGKLSLNRTPDGYSFSFNKS